MEFSLRRIMPLLMATCVIFSSFSVKPAEHAPARGFNFTKLATNAGLAALTAGVGYFLWLRLNHEYYEIKNIQKRLPNCETLALFNNWKATARNNQRWFNILDECERETIKLLPKGITYWWEDEFFEPNRFAALKCSECASGTTWQHFIIEMRHASKECNCRARYNNKVKKSLGHSPYAYWQPNLVKIMDTLWLIDQFRKIVDPLKQMQYFPLDYNHPG